MRTYLKSDTEKIKYLYTVTTLGFLKYPETFQSKQGLILFSLNLAKSFYLLLLKIGQLPISHFRLAR